MVLLLAIVTAPELFARRYGDPHVVQRHFSVYDDKDEGMQE